MTRQLYHLANIRELLIEGFDDRDLRRLCYDVPDLRPVYNELAQSTGKAEIVDELLVYAEKQLLVDTLLALARHRNPARYDQHGPYYYDDPTPALQKQLSDLAKRLADITSPTSLSREQQYQIAYHWQELGAKDSLRGFDLRGADLRMASLGGADLRMAKLQSADLSGANLQKADLRGANLASANLESASLAGARLVEADLKDAHLYGADLSGADLRGARLEPKYPFRVDLSDANLLGAHVDAEALSMATVSTNTVRPDGGRFIYDDDQARWKYRT
jgi:hypothetical protein